MENMLEEEKEAKTKDIIQCSYDSKLNTYTHTDRLYSNRAHEASNSSGNHSIIYSTEIPKFKWS
jgi:hypothetical protein